MGCGGREGGEPRGVAPRPAAPRSVWADEGATSGWITHPRQMLRLWVLPLAAAFHSQHPARLLSPRTERFAARVPLHPLCGSWLYPDEQQGVIELTSTAEADDEYGMAEVDEQSTVSRLGAWLGRRFRRSNQPALPAWKQRWAWRAVTLPSKAQRDARKQSINGLIKREVEEALHVLGDSASSIMSDALSGNVNASAVEQKVELLLDRHERRWPLVRWLLGQTSTGRGGTSLHQLDPSLVLLSDKERLQRRSEELSDAIRDLWPAFHYKVWTAIRRRPRLLPQLVGKMISASGLLAAWHLCRVLRMRPKRIFGLMNAFLNKMLDILNLARLPEEELLVDLDEAERLTNELPERLTNELQQGDSLSEAFLEALDDTLQLLSDMSTRHARALKAGEQLLQKSIWPVPWPNYE